MHALISKIESCVSGIITKTLVGAKPSTWIDFDTPEQHAAWKYSKSINERAQRQRLFSQDPSRKIHKVIHSTILTLGAAVQDELLISEEAKLEIQKKIKETGQKLVTREEAHQRNLKKQAGEKSEGERVAYNKSAKSKQSSAHPMTTYYFGRVSRHLSSELNNLGLGTHLSDEVESIRRLQNLLRISGYKDLFKALSKLAPSDETPALTIGSLFADKFAKHLAKTFPVRLTSQCCGI
jgi:cell division protein FtsL